MGWTAVSYWPLGQWSCFLLFNKDSMKQDPALSCWLTQGGAGQPVRRFSSLEAQLKWQGPGLCRLHDRGLRGGGRDGAGFHLEEDGVSVLRSTLRGDTLPHTHTHTRTHSPCATTLRGPHWKPCSQPDARQLSGSVRGRGPADSVLRETAEIVPGSSVLKGLRWHLVMVIKQLVGLFLQEAEGFGDRLFLKQRMSLLSQMTSTPTDCLFKVRHHAVLWAQRCDKPSSLHVPAAAAAAGRSAWSNTAVRLCSVGAGGGSAEADGRGQHIGLSPPVCAALEPRWTAFGGCRLSTCSSGLAQGHLTGSPGRADAAPGLLEPVSQMFVSPRLGAQRRWWFAHMACAGSSLLRPDRPLGASKGL